jgi:hypothetical protein
MNKNACHLTIQDLQVSLNKIFECQQKEIELKSKLGAIEAEMLLIQQIMKAHKLIDGEAN